MDSDVQTEDLYHVNQLLDKNDENVILQRTANESLENSSPAVTATEEHTDKMYLDILKKKLSVNPLLPQDDKINNVSVDHLIY